LNIFRSLFLLFFCSLNVSAQLDSLSKYLTFSAYVEVYYGYDFENPDNHQRPNFLYSYNRHNEVNLNLGFMKAAYEKDKIRANFALMAGTYANANLAHEPGTLKNIFEANVGVRLLKNKSFWLDVGVMPSHIGFESAIGMDCKNMSRSIVADNTPYYESGAKLSYESDNEKWLFSVLLLNGWQRIQRVPGNQTPSFGHQIQWKPKKGITLNSSSFIGSDTPDILQQKRYFHNFYFEHAFKDHWGYILGFDIGFEHFQQKSLIHYFYVPTLITWFDLSPAFTLSYRFEYFRDVNAVILHTENEIFGTSANLDYRIADNCLLRAEFRHFNSTSAVFTNNNFPSRLNTYLGMSIAVKF
jgi:hypothetical protein